MLERREGREVSFSIITDSLNTPFPLRLVLFLSLPKVSNSLKIVVKFYSPLSSFGTHLCDNSKFDTPRLINSKEILHFKFITRNQSVLSIEWIPSSVAFKSSLTSLRDLTMNSCSGTFSHGARIPPRKLRLVELIF